MKRKNIVIMGAGGRDFHNFNVLFRRDPSSKVVAFTAAQIPFIENRTYPLSFGKLYPKGIPYIRKKNSRNSSQNTLLTR